MKHLIAASRRLGLAVFACLALGAVSTQALAQNCTSNNLKIRIDPDHQTVPETIGGVPTLVTLDGAKSTAPGNLTFLWVQTAGPTVALNGPTNAKPTFTAPAVGPAGDVLTFRLTIRCSSGLTDSLTTNVNITDVVSNAPPTAIAVASPASATEGTLVTLDGSASTDPDPGTTLSYNWEQVSGSPLVTLANFNPAGSIVTFVAPNVSATTSLGFRLTVSDGSLTGSTTKLVNILWTNDPPVAHLACPANGLFEVDEGETVTYNGSDSSDTDGSIVSYAWAQVSGLPNLDIGGLVTPSITFNAPQLGYQQLGGTLIRLTVTDNEGASSSAECGLFIHDVTAPVISFPADITEEADSASGKAVTYSVLAQDAVDDEIAYTLPCTPASGSTFGLAAAPVKQNTTAVACTATDSAGNTANAGFNVTVQDTTGPVITVPGSHGIEATSAAGAIASFLATTADAVDGPGVASCVPATDTQFALGTTPVNCSATDARGNAAAPASFNLTVHDTTDPVVTPPDDVEVEATGPLTTVDFGTATASDAVGVTLISHDAPASFPVGVTTITWTAHDAAGNSGSATSNVTVKDTTPPVVTVPADIVGVEATSAAGATVGFTASASDLVDGDLVATCVPPSGSTFALGTTMVNCTATDLANNEGHAGFSVNVVDTTPPTIDAHDDVGPVEATGPTGATVAYASPATSDLVDGAGTATCAPLSGSTFALGETTVTCNATDNAGNAATSTSFKVTVVDTTPPTIAPRGDVAPVEATGPTGAPVSYASPATFDLVDGDGTATCAPLSGSTFALGETTVTCNATDNAGNSATSTSFKVTVVDTTPPVIAPRSDILDVEATGPSGAAVSYAPPATSDAVDGPATASCAPASGSTFALGMTTVTCNATDAAGNAAVATTFQIGVVDTTAPVVTAPADVTREATGPRTVVPHGSATATDAVGVASQSNDAPADFPLGTTTITWTATDAAGNTGSATSQVTVTDLTGPAFAPYPATIFATASANSQAAVSFDLPTATDLVDGPVAVSCDRTSGSSFAAGATTVTCSARDGRSPANVSTMSFVVQVDYTWTGFFRPVDNLPTINVVQAGSAIPVKFNLGGNQGLAIFATGYPNSGSVACGAGPSDVIAATETVTAGGSSLQYDATTGQYNYVWKTEKGWASSCRVLQLTLKDGSVRKALFQFKK